MKNICTAVLLLGSALAFAQVPGKLSYQGRLLRADGTPESGTASIGFSLYATPSGGSAIWSETQEIGLTEGYYSTTLGAQTAFPPGAFDGSERFLEISVAGNSLAPRQRIGTVPYALACDTVGGEHAAGLRDFAKLTNVPAGLTSPVAGASAAIVTKVTVSAKADICASSGPAHFELYVNGLLVPNSGRDLQTATSDYVAYDIAIAPPRYASEVAVAFTTDWKSSNCDVNLHVDRIVLTTAAGAIPVAATDTAHVIYDRGAFFDNVDVVPGTSTLDVNGALRFFISPHNSGAEALVSCSRVYFAPARTYTTLNTQLDADISGATTCGTGWHVCNYQEVTIYGTLGGCETPGVHAWIVGGFSNAEVHRRAIWNGQSDSASAQCQAGFYPSWYQSWKESPYRGRVHCMPSTNVQAVACCMNY